MTADRPAIEPRTEAGRNLLRDRAPSLDDTSPEAGDRWADYNDWKAAILAIEAEAAQGAAPLDLLAACHDAYHAWSHYFDAEGEARKDHWTPLCRAMDRLREAMRASEGAAPLDSTNMIRRIVAAYRYTGTDDPHRLEDEIIGAERYLAEAAQGAAPHVHEWKREYAPGYRQASEADDWTDTCACGATRSGGPFSPTRVSEGAAPRRLTCDCHGVGINACPWQGAAPRSEGLDGEALYRVWWQASWGAMDNPPQWERLSKDKRAVWADTARRLRRPSDERVPESEEPR